MFVLYYNFFLLLLLLLLLLFILTWTTPWIHVCPWKRKITKNLLKLVIDWTLYCISQNNILSNIISSSSSAAHCLLFTIWQLLTFYMLVNFVHFSSFNTSFSNRLIVIFEYRRCAQFSRIRIKWYGKLKYKFIINWLRKYVNVDIKWRK